MHPTDNWHQFRVQSYLKSFSSAVIVSHGSEVWGNRLFWLRRSNVVFLFVHICEWNRRNFLLPIVSALANIGHSASVIVRVPRAPVCPQLCLPRLAPVPLWLRSWSSQAGLRKCSLDFASTVRITFSTASKSPYLSTCLLIGFRFSVSVSTAFSGVSVMKCWLNSRLCLDV